METEWYVCRYLASADSATLLDNLLREARELPLPGDSAGIDTDPGIDTWSNLMRGIGRESDVLQSEGMLADRMLEQWVRCHLVPKPTMPTPTTPPPAIKVGTVITTTVSPETKMPADRFLIHDQFLHKALMLVLAEDGTDGKLSACILNRPTADVFRFNVPGNPQRRVPYCGNLELGGQLWLHHRPELGGVALGDSGILLMPADKVVEKLQTKQATVDDFLFVSGVVQFGRSEMAGMLAAGEMRLVPHGVQLSGLWPRVWSLTADDDAALSDGTEAWWLASQCGAGEQLAAAVPSDLADQALAEWLKFFARGR